MAYQTGTATSQNDLTQQLAAWLQTQGWTLDASQADGTGWRTHLHKGGWYVHLKCLPTNTPFNGYSNNQCNVPGLWCYLSTAFAGTSQNWYSSTTGAPLGTDGKVCGVGIVVNTGAQTSYHFFNDGSDHYTVVVERNPGVFQVFGFGLSITKHGGNWTGGPYIHGHMNGGNTVSYPLNSNSYCPFYYGSNEYGALNSAFLRADVETFTGNWIAIGPEVSLARNGWTGRQGFSSVLGLASSLPTTIPHTQALFSYSVSSINSQAVLLPIRIFVALAAGGAALLATAPAVFQCNAVGNGYSAGAELQLGADTYKVFPNFAVKKVA